MKRRGEELKTAKSSRTSDNSGETTTGIRMHTSFLSLGLVYTRYTCQVLAKSAPKERVNPIESSHNLDWGRGR